MTQFNRLLSRSYRAGMGKTHGPGACDETRCSGRTTAIKLRTVAACIEQPGVWVPVVDHYADGGSMRNRKFMGEVMDLVNAMGLKFFECDAGNASSGPRIRCNLFTDNQWEIT